MDFVSCPSCGTFVLEDTVQCHSCGHVLHEERAKMITPFTLPTDQAVDADMDVCPSCGEHCRKGLVRCWNCGSFTRPEIAEEYLKRAEAIRSQPKVEFDLPVLEASEVSESDSLVAREYDSNDSQQEFPPLGADDMGDFDDFELSDDVQLEGTGVVQPSETGAGDDSSPVFALQEVDKSDDAAAPIPSLSTDEKSEDQPKKEKGDAAKEEKEEKSEDADLLKIAAAEQAEIVKARMEIKNKDTFLVFCSHGHRIRVHERFRGKLGRCPKCGIEFVVPAKPLPKPKKEAEPAAEPAPAARYIRWLEDVRLHTVVPEKLKIKADSLLNEFQPVDVGFSPTEILVAGLVAGGGFFGGGAKKKPQVRTEMLEYFSKADASPDGAKVASKRVISTESISQMILAQPTPTGTESLFGDIPIFGVGRIAVRLPKIAEDKSTQYLSFSLSEFRAFTLALQTICGVEGFGSNSDVPFTDQYETHKCHYNSSSSIQAIKKLEYYQKDPGIKLEVTGWKCAKCGVIVGEEGRKKEKFGGVDGKAIAKAKCPKCKQPFGSNPIYKVAVDPAAAAAAEVEGGTDSESPA